MNPSDTLPRWTSHVLVVIGLGSLGWVALETSRVGAYREWPGPLELTAPPAPHIGPATPSAGQPIGYIRIPRLGLSAPLIEGDHEEALRAGVGHLPDTPLPWSEGNSALAGHRDTFFRLLRHIAVGDRITLATPSGAFEYRVNATFVVEPEDVWVLNATDRPTLTLITCYPFSFLGPAPRRFIVRADRLIG